MVKLGNGAKEYHKDWGKSDVKLSMFFHNYPFKKGGHNRSKREHKVSFQDNKSKLAY